MVKLFPRMDSTVQEHIPDLQLSRDYGNTLETLQPPVLTDNAEPNTEPSPHVESQTLFLSRRKLNEIPETILRHRSLKVGLDFTVDPSTHTNHTSTIPYTNYFFVFQKYFTHFGKLVVTHLPISFRSYILRATS